MAASDIPLEEEHDNDEPTPEEIEQMRQATPAEAAAVDEMILTHCSGRWRKVAMIVGALANEFDGRFPHLPLIYMPIRMIDLEERGAIEIQGDVLAMRYSEVRLREV